MIFRSNRANAAFCHDLVMAALSFLLSFYLRVGDTLGDYSWRLLAVYDLSFIAIAGAVFWWTGLYRGIWRYASLPDMLALLRAATIVMLLFFPAMFVLTRLDQLPRSMPFINWLVLMALLGGPRFAYRAYKDRGIGHVLERADRSHSIPVLLIGARDGAAMFIREMASDPDRLYRVVGIIADSSSRVGRDIAGVPVLGTIDELPQVIDALDRRGERPQRMIISAQSLDGAVVRRLLDTADALTIPLARLPRLTEFKATGTEEPSIEPVAIEDLLGRPQAVLDRAGMQALIAGRRVLVTGAGGTIGSELVRQIAAYHPARLVLVDNSEFALYTVDRELEERHPALPRQVLIGDVRDRGRVEEIIAAERPELVFHAAALKHVPMVEANPIEGVLTNALGTRFVAEACRAHGVRAMVMISTDKAVNPANVMGASKRLAESICQALDMQESRKAEGTRFVTVRFGNVLGSTGSVVPLFQRQLAAGGPLTVTHPEVQRYFMTVREAVELVLAASALAAAGREQRGRIFVLDMGEPVKIVDLARQMIRLAGKKPDIDIKLAFIGLRPGEKLYEELFYPNEPLVPTAAAGIRLATPRIIDYTMLQRSLDELAEHARERRQERMLALLGTLVPEFAAAGGGVTRAAEA
ncbi:MAG TPA: nucleoside-diphosphate sugar epimerase/dehydratase [Stellaceae bacterium]|jgi:O-antigen biosynthesis protein WbqV|nr:nucleoside-diphosphate sugar epimerase/dehydratase [Stellaceae bacterium]